MGGEGGVTIDASHAGVILDGSRASKGTYGLNILSNNNLIKGLQILNFPFPGGGIALSGEHNIIGGDRSRGEAPLGEGNETITVGGKPYACHWTKMKVASTKPAPTNGTVKVWNCGDVPAGGVVKMEMENEMTVGGKPMTSKMTMELKGFGK